MNPPTDTQLDAYETAIAAYQQHPDIGFACCSAHPAADAAASLLDENRRLRAKAREYGELAARREAELIALRAQRRTLTDSEYNRAWHAVEGAAGEEGADPGTVLHSVLDRLGIDLPPAPPVHACPPVGSGVTPCCGRTPFELPRTDRMATDPTHVTCTGQGV